jgi:hypothetical protein
MKGNNSLILCMAEMKIAMQEYLNKRLGAYAPEVRNIKVNVSEHTFEIQMQEQTKGVSNLHD